MTEMISISVQQDSSDKSSSSSAASSSFFGMAHLSLKPSAKIMKIFPSPLLFWKTLIPSNAL